MDTSTHKSPVQLDAMDKYTASIELSNACRQFYQSRVKAAHCIKSRWEKQGHPACRGTNDNDRPADDSKNRHRPQKSSIDEAMGRLRTEMTSLMDQDLSLMKQLLTLNETIEDLKWQRRYYYTPSSSADLHHSDSSLSDTDMYESEDDLHYLHPTSTTTTGTTTTSSCRKHSLTTYSGEKRCLDSDVMVVAESSVKVYHGEQDSFDSGIHESSSEEEASEASV